MAETTARNMLLLLTANRNRTFVKTVKRLAGVASRQGCPGSGKTGNFDVYFFRQDIRRERVKMPQNTENVSTFLPPTQENFFSVLKLKGCTRKLLEFLNLKNIPGF